MSKKVFIGIDNGVTGTIGIITPDRVEFFKTPTISQQNYTKKKGNISRVDVHGLRGKIMNALLTEDFGMYPTEEIIVGIERPMVNPSRFKATTSALRALEATLVLVEELELPYEYLDSKEWQKAMLPQGVKGSSELKKASVDIGNRIFSQFSSLKHGDRDGILMAEYMRRKWK